MNQKKKPHAGSKAELRHIYIRFHIISTLSESPFLLPYSGLSRLLPSMSQRRGLWGDWEFPPSPACFGGVPLL